MARKVKVGQVYTFNPCMWDVLDAKGPLVKGDKVKVVNLPGAPKANTMGHCYAEHVTTHHVQLVHCNSLEA